MEICQRNQVNNPMMSEGYALWFQINVTSKSQDTKIKDSKKCTNQNLEGLQVYNAKVFKHQS